MSKILGPIHYWLYNKIVKQEQLIRYLIKDTAYIDNQCGTIIIDDLSSIIDESNIHGYLQQLIDVVEKRYALCIKQLLLEKDLEQIKQSVYQFAISTHNFENSKEAYKYINDTLLNGMPCDHINQIKVNENNLVVWINQRCLHEQYFSEIDVDINIYYQLIDTYIEGIISNSNLQYTRNNQEYSIALKTDCIDLLVDEHQNILRLLNCMEMMCCNIIDNKIIDINDFKIIIYIARNYADKYHHQKEEQILFKYMIDNLGLPANKLINNGMLVEHDLGRLHIKNLEIALNNSNDTKRKVNIIGETMGYVQLLRRHIEKEDAIVYKYAKNNLSNELIKKINDETLKYQSDINEKELLQQLNQLEIKYGI